MTTLPSQQTTPMKRRSERKVLPRLERARLSDLENCMDQLINLLAQWQPSQGEPVSQTRRSPSPRRLSITLWKIEACAEGGVLGEEKRT